MRRALVLLITLLAQAACSPSSGEPGGGIAGSGGQGGTGGTGSVGGTGGIGGTGGSGGAEVGCGIEPAYDCIVQCPSDWFFEPECRNGQWVCPTVDVMGESVQSYPEPECPSWRCGGPPPLPGESCIDGEWFCEPPDEVWAACEQYMCATCNGFPAGEQERFGCRCACDSTGYWVICSPSTDD